MNRIKTVWGDPNQRLPVGEQREKSVWNRITDFFTGSIPRQKGKTIFRRKLAGRRWIGSAGIQRRCDPSSSLEQATELSGSSLRLRSEHAPSSCSPILSSLPISAPLYFTLRLSIHTYTCVQRLPLFRAVFLLSPL